MDPWDGLQRSTLSGHSAASRIRRVYGPLDVRRVFPSMIGHASEIAFGSQHLSTGVPADAIEIGHVDRFQRGHRLLVAPVEVGKNFA